MTTQLFSRSAVLFLAFGWTLPALAAGQAETPAVLGQSPNKETQKVEIHDIELDAGGALKGQTSGRNAAPIQNITVRLYRDKQLVSETTANHEGRFEIAGLRGGIYQLSTGNHQVVLRLWTHGAAPPSAASEALIVADDSAVRGQRFGGISDGVFRYDEFGGLVGVAAIIGGGATIQKLRRDGS